MFNCEEAFRGAIDLCGSDTWNALVQRGGLFPDVMGFVRQVDESFMLFG
jgi:hypothetical protein